MYNTIKLIFGIAIAITMTTSAMSAEWVDSGKMGDWSGNDYACTTSAKPAKRWCDEYRRGNVAVCWTNRGVGHPDIANNDCAGANAWCTYKSNISLNSGAGAAPGRVYFCAN